MKTTIYLLFTGQFTQALQQMFGIKNNSVQPLPAYWVMAPHSKDAMMQERRK